MNKFPDEEESQENSAYWDGLVQFMEESLEKQYWKDLEKIMMESENLESEDLDPEEPHTAS